MAGKNKSPRRTQERVPRSRGAIAVWLLRRVLTHPGGRLPPRYSANSASILAAQMKSFSDSPPMAWVQ